MITDNDKNVPTNNERVMVRWKEHFGKLVREESERASRESSEAVHLPYREEE